MFTDTMTAREIRLIVKHESEALDRTMTRFVKEFRKRIRGRRKGGVFQIGHLFKTHEKNEYYAILTNANKDEVYTALLPTYMTNKGRVFFSESERSNDEYTVIQVSQVNKI